MPNHFRILHATISEIDNDTAEFGSMLSLTPRSQNIYFAMAINFYTTYFPINQDTEELDSVVPMTL